MEPLVWVIIAWLATFGGVYAWKRNLLKAFLFTSLMFTIAFSFLGVFVYYDVNDLKQNLMTEPKLFVLADGKVPIAAFAAEDLAESAPMYLDDAMILAMDDELKVGTYEGDAYYKVFVLQWDALKREMPPSMLFDDIEYRSTDVIATIESSSPRDYFAESVAPELFAGMISESTRRSFLDQLGDDSEFRSQVFAVSFSSAIQERGPKLMLELLNSGELVVLPESIAFKFLRSVPPAMVENMMGIVQGGYA